jgi:hypothetical protein
MSRPSTGWTLDERTPNMAKFMLIYRNPAETAAPPSPEEMQAVLGKWNAWFQRFGGAILDGGDGLKPGGRVLMPGGIVTDGPYAESKEVIGGYSVVQAEDHEGALAIARECPFAARGVIEIREFAGYNKK